MLELTDEERKNGWDEKSLKAYLEEREKAQANTVLNRDPPKPRWANSLYNPLRFGR